MTHKVRAKRLVYLQQREMVAKLNALRWAQHARDLMQQQIDLLSEGITRGQIAGRITKLRTLGVMAVAEEERQKRLQQSKAGEK